MPITFSNTSGTGNFTLVNNSNSGRLTMSAGGASIVTSGLILYLDAGNTSSYPGSGTTWTDLSGNGSNGTLTNGPTFSSSNNGILTFNGTSQYAEMSTRNTALEFQPLQPYSCFVFYRSPSTAATGAIIANMLSGSPFSGWDLWFNNNSISNTIGMHLISSWSTNAIKIAVTYDYAAYANQWIYFGYTYNGSSPTTSGASLSSVNFYLNGNLYTTGKAMDGTTDGFNTSSETITYNTNQRFRVTSRWSSGAWNSGADRSTSISLVQAYNRALSASEVAQNYNAQKSRFGL
jgi:hypothetical protein